MRPRIRLAYFLLRAGSAIRSASLMVMKPEDLIQFGYETYMQHETLKQFNSKEVIEMGLTDAESLLLNQIPEKTGSLLLLGVGGGRMVFPLAMAGFQITALDFSEGMLENTRLNASRRGIAISTLNQDISQMDIGVDEYDVILTSPSLYSLVPTQEKRSDFLEKIHTALKPGGYFLCQFQVDSLKKFSRKTECFKKSIAFFSRGYTEYQQGDTLWGGKEFLHAFQSEEEIKSEFIKAGFIISFFNFPRKGVRGEAALNKSSDKTF